MVATLADPDVSPIVVCLLQEDRVTSFLDELGNYVTELIAQEHTPSPSSMAAPAW